MGFLRKKFKQVKNAVKKVGKAVKKAVKKITKSKLFKIIATVGAVLATGGAAIGAFGGSFASSAFGQAIINGGKFFAKFNPTSFKPFTAAGKFIGSSLAGKAGTAAVEGTTTATATAAEGAAAAVEGAAAAEGAIGAGGGFGVQTGTLATGQGGGGTIGSVAKGAATKTSTASKLAKGTVIGDVARNVISNVGTGMVMQKIQGDPDNTGVVTGLNLAGENHLENLAVAYSDANIKNLEDIYKTNYYGTADVGFNTDVPLFQQETLAIT